MTRDELREVIKAECANVVELFQRKNQSYGAADEAFYNFIETARRVLGSPDPGPAFQVLLAYVDKHLLALANRGLEDPEAEERLRDIVVYGLIGLAMAKERQAAAGGAGRSPGQCACETAWRRCSGLYADVPEAEGKELCRQLEILTAELNRKGPN